MTTRRLCEVLSDFMTLGGQTLTEAQQDVLYAVLKVLVEAGKIRMETKG